jgi:hypothetical protein
MFCFLFFPVCNPLVATRNKDTKLLLLFLNEQKKKQNKKQGKKGTMCRGPDI